MLKKDFILSNFAVFVTLGIALFSGLFLLIGCYHYHVTPWYNLQEIGYKQQQNDLKNDFTNFHKDLGIRFLFAGRVDAAKNEFTKVLEVDRLNQNATRYLVLCEIFNNTTLDFRNIKNRDDEITRQQLDALINETPNDPLLYFYLGSLFHSMAYYDDAITYYQKAINLSNDSFAAAYHYIGLIMSLEQYRIFARENLTKAVKLSPYTWIYINDLADEYYVSENYNKSLNRYILAQKLKPYALLPYFGIFKSYRCLDDLENATKMQEQQIAVLEDNLSFNQKGFCWVTNSTKLPYICLSTYDEIQYYCYYSIALTYYLSENKAENKAKTQEYLQKAYDLRLSKKSKLKVENLLNYDIETLQNAQHRFINKTNEFKNKYFFAQDHVGSVAIPV